MSYAILDAARVQAGLSFEDLWIAYFALGGKAHPNEVRSYLWGAPRPSMEYDVLAQAINERFLDRGGDHPVPYSDDLT